MNKPILYIDMDNVLVDLRSALNKVPPDLLDEYAERFHEIPGIFSLMDPMPGAIAAVHDLIAEYEISILSTAPWLNPSAWSDKVNWIQTHFRVGQASPVHKR